jgi:hypothetical protein
MLDTDSRFFHSWKQKNRTRSERRQHFARAAGMLCQACNTFLKQRADSNLRQKLKRTTKEQW